MNDSELDLLIKVLRSPTYNVVNYLATDDDNRVDLRREVADATIDKSMEFLKAYSDQYKYERAEDGKMYLSYMIRDSPEGFATAAVTNAIVILDVLSKFRNKIPLADQEKMIFQALENLLSVSWVSAAAAKGKTDELADIMRAVEKEMTGDSDGSMEIWSKYINDIGDDEEEEG
jgi:hypothetical protein